MDMSIDEALAECDRWLAHLDRQRERTVEMQRAARIARKGDIAQAQEIERRIDRSVQVYDAAKLAQAVHKLCICQRAALQAK